MFISNTVVMSMAMHLYYIQDYSVNSPIYIFIDEIEYVSAAFYNLLATLYMLWRFKPLRKIMLHDLAVICFIDARPNMVETHEINWIQEREDHFAYLQSFSNELPENLRQHPNYRR